MKFVKCKVALLTCLFVLSFIFPAFAATANDGSAPYAGYTGNPETKDPKELITQEYFGNEWVNTIPDGIKGIPSPWDHHGYIAGSPKRLTTSKEMYDYYTKLAEKSPRVKLINIGKTTAGLNEYIVAISSADTIARLDEYQANLKKLADPRVLGFPANEKEADAAAEELITKANKTKPIFWVLAKIHGTEVGSGEMAMELAYRLAVEERDIFKKIRANELVFITDPNPDGTQMVADYVNKYIGTKWDGANPPFYNYYSQHDNNRDSNNNAQPEQLQLVKAFNHWPAQVVLDIHQSMFLLFTFSGMEPTFPSIDPITQTEWQWFASKELNQMERFNMPGVWEYKYVNMYYPMYQLQAVNLRNGTGKFYEVFGNAYPTTRTIDATKQTLAGGDPAQKWFWYNPDPYRLPKLVWSFRNNINYSQTATLTTALEIANNRETVLRNYWTKAKRAIILPGTKAIGCSGPFTYPFAYVIPAGQKDMPEKIKMINNLLDNGIEVRRADVDFVAGGKPYPQGSYIISLAQPFSRLVYALLEPQKYPQNTTKSYDATGWTYGPMRDVETYRVDEQSILTVPSTLITGEQVTFPGTISEKISAGYYLIKHNSVNNLVTFVFALAQRGYRAYAAEKNGKDIKIGDILIPADQKEVYAAITPLVKNLGLTMRSLTGTVTSKHELNVPRIAMYHSWAGVQEGGWSRWFFDTLKIPYTIIQNDDVRAGGLRDRYDVIFLPDVGETALKDGLKEGSVPEEVTEGPILTKHRTGGLGDAGIASLRDFVNNGGVLVTNNQSSYLPLKNDFVAGVSAVPSDAPGPIVNIQVNPNHPVAYGANLKETMYVDRSPVFNAPKDWVIASYPENPADLLVSGDLPPKTQAILAGKAAIVDAPGKAGKGHVVLFGTDITYRGQAWGSFFLLVNTLLNWDDLSVK